MYPLEAGAAFVIIYRHGECPFVLQYQSICFHLEILFTKNACCLGTNVGTFEKPYIPSPFSWCSSALSEVVGFPLCASSFLQLHANGVFIRHYFVLKTSDVTAMDFLRTEFYLHRIRIPRQCQVRFFRTKIDSCLQSSHTSPPVHRRESRVDKITSHAKNRILFQAGLNSHVAALDDILV